MWSSTASVFLNNARLPQQGHGTPGLQHPMPSMYSENDELDWVIAFANSRAEANSPMTFGIASSVRRRIAAIVKTEGVVLDPVFSFLSKPVTEVPLICQIVASLNTGPEVVPYLDVLLISIPRFPGVLDILSVSGLELFQNLLASYPMDRQVAIRALALTRLMDDDVFLRIQSRHESECVLSILSECRRLMNVTIDPLIRQNALDTANYLELAIQRLGLGSSKPVQRLSREELLSYRTKKTLCLRCDKGDHDECDSPVVNCPNCRGDRNLCIPGCRQPCRVCDKVHPEVSLASCIDSILRAEKSSKKNIEQSLADTSTKQMRSVREYKEQKKRDKKRSHDSSALATSSTNVSPFEKILKDTVARHCFAKLSSLETGEHGVPEWRKVSRFISSTLIDKESRLPEAIRFRCSTESEKSSLVKRVGQFCEEYLQKHFS